MKAAFKFKLGSEISPGLVTVGRFDGKHPSLAAATPTGKIVLHSPHGSGGSGGFSAGFSAGGSGDPAIRHLKMSSSITAIAAGCVKPGESRADALLIGTETTLQAYSTEENRDLFFTDVGDGISSIVCGYLGAVPADAPGGRFLRRGAPVSSSAGGKSSSSSSSSSSASDGGAAVSNVLPPTVFAGGDLSVHGFGDSGEETFWTVTGGNIGAMALMDVDGDGRNELLVGSDDYEIRTFRGEEVVCETTETAPITHLCPMSSSSSRHTHDSSGKDKTSSKLFAYGLSNGTLGVYNGSSSRVWRMKSKNTLTAVASFDIDGDGVPEVCSGWSNGKFEVRRDRDGSVVFKDKIGSPVAGLVVGDYRLDGAEQIVVCSQSGSVRGYLPFEGVAGTQLLKEKEEDTAVNELLAQKQELLLALRGIEGSVKQLKNGEPAGAGTIDPDTKVTLTTEVNIPHRCLDMTVKTSNETVVRCAVTYNLDGGVLDGESYVVHPSTPTPELRIPLRPVKDIETKLQVHAMVGARGNSSHYHVFELEAGLPKFATLVGDVSASAAGGSRSQRRNAGNKQRGSSGLNNDAAGGGSCVFYLNERVDRVHDWASKAFLGLGDGKTGALRGGTSSLELDLLSLRTGDTCQMDMVQESTGNKVTIFCGSMQVAGDVIQDMCRFLGISLLESTADFPRDFEMFREVLERVDKHKELRQRMTADMADMTHSVKTMVIRAEDSRVLCDWDVS
jgi:Bardet-Biedl syndrome 2 protein